MNPGTELLQGLGLGAWQILLNYLFIALCFASISSLKPIAPDQMCLSRKRFAIEISPVGPDRMFNEMMLPDNKNNLSVLWVSWLMRLC